MTRVDGPVSMTARIDMRVSGDIGVSFETEFVVTDAEEAEEKGTQFKGLLDSFMVGYGNAGEA